MIKNFNGSVISVCNKFKLNFICIFCFQNYLKKMGPPKNSLHNSHIEFKNVKCLGSLHMILTSDLPRLKQAPLVNSSQCHSASCKQIHMKKNIREMICFPANIGMWCVFIINKRKIKSATSDY